MYESPTDDVNQQVSETISEAAEMQKQRGRTTLVIFLILIVGVILYGMLSGSASIEAAVDSQTLGVASSSDYSRFTALADITQVELIEDFDTGDAVDIIESENLYLGTYENDLLGEYDICAYQKCTTVIVVYTEDSVFVFNRSSASATSSYYETVVEAVEGYEG